MSGKTENPKGNKMFKYKKEFQQGVYHPLAPTERALIVTIYQHQ